jgi:hypothetical protein
MTGLNTAKGSSDTTTNQTQTANSAGTTTAQTSPWDVQSNYLQDAFKQASAANATAGGAVAPTNFTAQYAPDQLSAFQQMLKYGTGNTNIPSSTAAAGGALTNGGATAANAGLSTLTNFNPSGGTQSNIDSANQYVAGANIPDQVKAAMLGANQEASEQTLPSITRASAGSGNINSSRNAIQQGIVERGLGQQAGALSAQLTGDAYKSGLTLAQQQSQANDASRLAAASGAASGGTSAVATGTNANSSAIGQQGGLFDIANGGITGQQTAAQADLTNKAQQYASATSAPFDAVKQFMNIIGANNWGSSSSGTVSGNSTGTSQGTSNTETTSTPSLFQTLGGLMSAGGSLMKSDRRTKTDIRMVGQLFNGQRVYRFRYRNDPTRTMQIGLMAQDVAKTLPRAVTTIRGVKHVNYELATA